MRTIISWPTFIPHLLLLQFFLGAPGATLPPWNKIYSLTSSGIDSLFWSQNHLPPGGKSVLAALPLGATIWVSGKPLWGGGWWCWAFCLPVSNPPSSDWGFGNGAPPLETQPRQNQSNDDSADFFSARLQGTQALHVSIFRLYTLTKGWILQTEMREVQATPSKKPVLNNAVQYQRTTSHSCNLNVSSSCIQVSTEKQVPPSTSNIFFSSLILTTSIWTKSFHFLILQMVTLRTRGIKTVLRVARWQVA